MKTNENMYETNKWEYAHTYELPKTFLEDCCALWHLHLQLSMFPVTPKNNNNNNNFFLMAQHINLVFLVSFGIGFLCVCVQMRDIWKIKSETPKHK